MAHEMIQDFIEEDGFCLENPGLVSIVLEKNYSIRLLYEALPDEEKPRDEGHGKADAKSATNSQESLLSKLGEIGYVDTEMRVNEFPEEAYSQNDSTDAGLSMKQAIEEEVQLEESVDEHYGRSVRDIMNVQKLHE